MFEHTYLFFIMAISPHFRIIVKSSNNTNIEVYRNFVVNKKHVK